MTGGGTSWRRVRWPMPPIGPARGRTVREAIVLAVRARDGATGLGEAAPLPGISRETIEACEAALAGADAHVNADVATRDEACTVAAQLELPPAARFAVETALLHVIAQRAGRSIASLWGAADRPLVSAVVVDDEAEARATGVRCLKVKVGDRDDRERVERIARAAPHARLRLDANRRWPRGEVRERMVALRGLPIDYVEEPCERAHELCDECEPALPLPIALDESLAELARDELVRVLRSHRIAALVVKPTVLGGFVRGLELAELARGHGVPAVVTHALEGPIGTAACGELARIVAAGIEVGLAPHPGLARWAEAV